MDFQLIKQEISKYPLSSMPLFDPTYICALTSASAEKALVQVNPARILPPLTYSSMFRMVFPCQKFHGRLEIPRNPSWGGFHKPIYALCQAVTLCAKLLRPKKLLKSWRRA